MTHDPARPVDPSGSGTGVPVPKGRAVPVAANDAIVGTPSAGVAATGVPLAPLDTRCAIATLDAAGRPLAANAAFAELFALVSPDASLVDAALRRFGEGALPLAERLAGTDAFALPLGSVGDRGAITLQCTALDAGRRTAVVDAAAPPGASGQASPDEAARRTETHGDALTGLGNRRLLDDALAALGDAPGDLAPAALLMVDLDRFKQVNDTLGHGTGDRLLQLVARRIRRATRGDDVLARLGGDEFVALLHGEDLEAMATSTAARIVELVSRPFLVDGQQVNIGASVGIAMLDGRRSSLADLVRHADLALYAAKRSGRGAWRVFEPALETRALERRELELALRRALGLREFALVYQPQVRMSDREVTGFEALIRWNHPDRGLVSPADFIPLAEEIGEIDAIGEWVLQCACLEAVGWSERLSVAVNVSPRQFESGRFVDSVREALERSGLAPERLEIEITEGVLIDNVASALAHLEAIRAMGVSIAMDDFGTGYSSLSYLNSFPFSKIKIDQSFVRGAQTTRSRALVDAIITLGDSLGMETIAEGVETDDQLERLASGGCRSVQGYLTGRPMPASAIDAFLGAPRDRGPRNGEDT